MPRTLTKEDLCIHQVCVWKQSSFADSLDSFARHGITKTAIWRPMVEDIGVNQAKKILDNSSVSAISMCPLVLLDPDKLLDWASREQEHIRYLEDAAELRVKTAVVITGGLPPKSNDLAGRRQAVLEELARLIPVAEESGLKLALEPLHPMVCGFRSVVSTLGEANDILDALDRDDVMGIAVDSYALWWDPKLKEEILRAGPRICNFHVSDWLPETRDVRVDRGMPGDGLIDNPLIRSWMEQAGYKGPVEVEILSALDWWLKPADTVVKTICERIEFL
ncbi:MAG: sugar phosphate isomerase/epimerase [SAR202 cluster bacterium]|nr:xylose isomerase [Chloroflexota bacterium]MDP6420514.1 sugar phosphate isomerase/epimerase [SAR202 cluster bacterium]HAL48580.1 xylose isomerase [Dehalococcoidia bacterium]MDP6664012.1 sugar phosphate isomerase/epimerase [SAR202 cluster bacterium]MDP6799179.1 sugar phosphate isomerase/epimerase [SAR202 cluster bacterium]|tara:strand:- start:12477 stop:13310 length:834 start_codon:yes stop_codon:yes gene_type:complete